MFATDFDMGTGTFNMTGAGGNDIFVMKLNGGFSGINEAILDNASVKVYPNPSSGYFSVMFSDELKNVVVIISDVTGKEILKQQLSKMQQVDLNMNDPGLYFVTIESEGKRTVKKVVIQ